MPGEMTPDEQGRSDPVPNRWAAFTDDELNVVRECVRDSIREAVAARLYAEAKAELERRRGDA